MRDSFLCSELGTPAAALVTTPFETLARRTAKVLGVPDFPILVVEHPIWTRDQAWLEAAAEKLMDPLIETLFGARSK